MIDRAAGQIADPGGRRIDLGLPGLVRKFHDRIGIGDIKIVADQHHAERRIQSIHCAEEDAARLGNSVAVGVAQQRDAVGARHAGAGPFLKLLVDESLDARGVVRLGRCVAFGDQHVAVRQHIDGAGMIEPAGEGIHRHAAGGLGLVTGWPAGGGCDVDRRYPGLLWRRQRGRGAIALLGGGGVPRVVAGRQAAAPSPRSTLPTSDFCAWWEP